MSTPLTLIDAQVPPMGSVELPAPQIPAALGTHLPPSAAITPPGEPITLEGGQVFLLRYSFASLARIESEFGSIAGVSRRLQRAARAMQSALDDNDDAEPMSGGELFTVLASVLAAGLLHYRVRNPLSGNEIRLGDDIELLMERLDPAYVQEYVSAFGRALGTTFGGLGKAPEDETPQTTPSLGNSGTTSPSSPSGDQNESSGT